MNTPSNIRDNKPLQVRLGRVQSVDLYEIKDNELDLLEKGSPATIQLNFAVFLLSVAFSSIAALCTATFRWDIAQTIFVFIAVVGILLGSYLLLSWWRTRTSISALIKSIRARIEQPIAATKTSQKSTDSESIVENEPAG